MQTVLISIVGMVFVIGFIVGIHEWGHFIAARLIGIKVLRFSIGFGKPLLRWHGKKGTEYVLAAIPLGGYVQMLDENESPVKHEELSLAFNRKPAYKKILVVLAGPLANFLLAFLIYWILLMMGVTVLRPIVGEVTPHSIADQARFQPQQEIMRINDEPTSGWMSVIIQLFLHVGDEKPLMIETKHLKTDQLTNHRLEMQNVLLDDYQPDPLKSIGMMPYLPQTVGSQQALLRWMQYQPLPALHHAWRNLKLGIQLNGITFAKMLKGQISLHSMGGPMTIIEIAGLSLKQGIISFLSFIAFFSISIGIINLFPIPGLDGGHLLFHTIEWLTGRSIPITVQAILLRIGIFILLLLFLQVIINDVIRLSPF